MALAREVRASGGAAKLYGGKIHRHRERYFHIVGEEIQRDVGHDLDDVLIVKAGSAQGLHVGFSHLAAVVHQFDDSLA